MRRCFRYALLFVAILAFQLPNRMSAQVDCRKKLQEYMKKYPASDLCDVYKFCFQDVFGPAHLITDSAAAMKAIDDELQKFKTLGGPDYEYTGCEGNYVRVNLRLVKEGKISTSKLAGCLSRSAQTPSAMTVEEWKYRWSQLENILVAMKPAPGHFVLDSQSIETLLDKGGYAVHHSYSYNSTYNFHYRIIRKDIFEKEILSLSTN